jgi:hypothetical protein
VEAAQAFAIHWESLLFYVSNDTVSVTTTQLNGGKVYGKDHQLMSGGDSINSQGWYYELVIIPVPNSNDLYYVFSIGVTAFYGIYYSVIDMSLNGGLGEVTQKNVQLQNFANVPMD